MATRPPEPLPKVGTGTFKLLLESVMRALDLPRLALVLEGALDRRSLEEVLRKFLRGGALRPGSLSRPELVAAVAEAFVRTPDAAWLTMRALDKSCSKERHIAASIDEDLVDSRLSSYRALDFRRERARLIWALLRDGRAGHVAAAERILAEAFDAMAREAQVEHVVEAAPSEEHAQVIQERLHTYQAALDEQGALLQHRESERRAFERERSELLVRVGRQELALKAEQERRRGAEDELRRLRQEILELRAQLEELDEDRLRDVLAERDRLRERARSLERQAERAEQLASLSAENEALRAEVAQLRREGEHGRREHDALVRQLTVREQVALERVDSLRASLRTARKLAAAPTDPSVAEGEAVVERVGVFLDATNLAASARRAFQGKFDFLRLLPELVSGRRKVMAIAFVVNNDEVDGGAGNFAGFVRALQGAGYEVRQKRPKVRADGTRKADWDMGLAMEVIDARSRLDVVVLGSGDGDFLPLVNRLKRWGKRVEVAAYAASTDVELRRAADEFIALDERFEMRE